MGSYKKLCIHIPSTKMVLLNENINIFLNGESIKISSIFANLFWGHCILMVAYIINKFAKKVLNNKTPHEVLLKNTPSYKHLKVFGCLVYAFDSLGKKDKFAEGGRPCVFLHYPVRQKTYKLYDLINKKTCISRNIIFVEDLFPFGNNYEINKDTGSSNFFESLHKLQQDMADEMNPRSIIRKTMVKNMKMTHTKLLRT